MKFLYRYYSKFRKHRQDEIKRIVRSENILQTIKHKSLSNKESLLNELPRNQKFVVSLTSFGQRINSVYLAIESLSLQTIKPDEIVLWLSDKGFKEDTLPVTIQRLINRGLKVRFCKDVGPHTKLLYAINEYPNDIVISIDDDIIYPHDLVENLYKTNLLYPDNICCNVARIITKDDNGKYTPYNTWEKQSSKMINSKLLMPLGVNGVLYPPNCFNQHVFDVSLIKSLCPTADDVWFKVMSLKNDTDISLTGSYPDFENSFIPLDTSYISALAQHNILNNMNDIQFGNSMNHFDLKI